MHACDCELKGLALTVKKWERHVDSCTSSCHVPDKNDSAPFCSQTHFMGSPPVMLHTKTLFRHGPYDTVNNLAQQLRPLWTNPTFRLGFSWQCGESVSHWDGALKTQSLGLCSGLTVELQTYHLVGLLAHAVKCMYDFMISALLIVQYVAKNFSLTTVLPSVDG